MAAGSGGAAGMGCGGDEDVWDDRELIRAYDKAVKNWRRNQSQSDDGKAPSLEETPGIGPWREVGDGDNDQSVAKIEAPPLSSAELLEVGSWIIGAPCRALYFEDGLEYEAKIVGIEGPKCTVRFVGYGNEEQVNLMDLRTTHGKQSRAKQRRDAFEYQQNIARSNADEIADRISNISVSSSMYNNCTESVCRDDGDLEDTITDGRQPLQASTPRSILFSSGPKQTSNSLAKLRIPKAGSLLSQSIDTVETGMPSCAEATIDSSSEVSSLAEEPQQTPVNLANGDWENFNNTMPQFRFPVPPMPLSLSNKDGAFDFSRGELPSLLMSWYMAGYQAGFFDAKQELTSPNRNREERMNTSVKSPNRL